MRQEPSSADSDFERVVARLLSKPHVDTGDFYVAQEPLIHTAESMSAIQRLRAKVLESVAGLPIDDAVARAEQMLRSQNDVHLKYIFSTGDINAPDRSRDSTYFVTDEQFSIRLKKANRDTADIARVVQPVMEIIVFEGEKRNVSFEPERGLRVYEYTSETFHKMQIGAEPFRDYTSTKALALSPYGNILVIGSDPSKIRHRGHQVNRISAASVQMLAPSRLKGK